MNYANQRWPPSFNDQSWPHLYGDGPQWPDLQRSPAEALCDETRFLSYYACYLDGHPWVRLSSTATAYYAAQIYLLNPVFTTEEGAVPLGTLLVISWVVEEGIRNIHGKRCLTTTRCSSMP